MTPKLLLNKVNSIDPMEFERVMKDFNDRAKYSQSDRLILRFTKIFYFAAYYLIFSRMKNKKFKTLSKIINTIKVGLYGED